MYRFHSFKNGTGPAGPTGLTGNRSLIRSGYGKKPEMNLKPASSIWELETGVVEPVNDRLEIFTFPLKLRCFGPQQNPNN